MVKLMKMSDVAQILDISLDRAYALGREGIIPIVRIGRQMRVDPDTLYNWIHSGGKSLSGGWKIAME